MAHQGLASLWQETQPGLKGNSLMIERRLRMSSKINFGPDMQDYGRIVLQELIKTDYGPGSSFNGISGHGPDTHGGTHELHEQVTLFQPVVKGSGLTIRFFDK